MMIWMVVFWAAVVLCIAWVARGGCSSWRSEDARDTLDRRFAEGGISLDEYRQRKAALVGQPVEVSLTSEATGEGAGS